MLVWIPLAGAAWCFAVMLRRDHDDSRRTKSLWWMALTGKTYNFGWAAGTVICLIAAMAVGSR